MRMHKDIFRDAVALPSQRKSSPTAAQVAQTNIFVSQLAAKHQAFAVADAHTNNRHRDALVFIAPREDGFIARNLRTGIVAFFSSADIHEEAS